MTTLQTNKKYLLTDSRKLTSPRESIFFAIKGLHHDGHQYIPELYQKGVREFVVEKAAYQPDNRLFPDATFWEVAQSIEALQSVAAAHRQQFGVPVVGITGSNGKTIVKEWLAQLLAKDFNVVRSPKSYNSQLGVPLSVWQMNASHTLGIFEAGVSKPHEMKHLEAVIRPTIGIFTNIGSAHDEGFESRQQKIKEKLDLFAHCGVLVYCRDYGLIDEQVKSYLKPINPQCKLVGWSKHDEHGPHKVKVQKTNTETHLSLQSERGSYVLTVPFVDDASIENVIHCAWVMLHLGVSLTDVHRLRPVSMRLELKEGINGCYLIDDSYNNDLAGLSLALDFLGQQQQRKHKVVMLSDILEAATPEAELYQQVAKLLRNKGVNQLIGIGEGISKHQQLFTPPAKFFESTEAFLAKLRPSDFWQSVILVKGARKYQFEKIINRLVQKTHGTTLEINLDALSHNLNFFREKLGPQTRLMVMVKAFAYGSGSAEVANLLQFHRSDYLAVAYADEGVFLRENGIQTPIMVMNPSAATFQKMIQYNLEPEIYSPRILQELLEFCTNQEIGALKIHLKLDTGMHRLGFEPWQMPELLALLKQNTQLSVATVFSHLAAADESHYDDFTQHQVRLFGEMADQTEQALGYAPWRHLLNSAGIARFPDARMDMVRLGIGLYGVAVRPEDQANLRVVGTLKTVISQIKTIKAGDTVGYGRRGVVAADTCTATIAIGYADGYDRRFSRGVGKVLVNGRLCPVIGNVCMDMTMIDVTQAQAQEGDEVVVFGETPTIGELAEWIGTIPYEILTNVSERVKRVFYREGN